MRRELLRRILLLRETSSHAPSFVECHVVPVLPDVACVHRSWRGPYARRPTPEADGCSAHVFVLGGKLIDQKVNAFGLVAWAQPPIAREGDQSVQR